MTLMFGRKFFRKQIRIDETMACFPWAFESLEQI